MNCTEARVLLAAQREIRQGSPATAELDEHLEQCSACREVLASYTTVGEQIQALPKIEPSREAYVKLMRALAAEHTQFLQQSPATTPPPPAFLKPYMHEHALSQKETDPLAAFSTADTGPLPVIRSIQKKQRPARLGPFAIIGLAAMFMLVLMTGGITTLLIVANSATSGSGSGPISINQPAAFTTISYTTNTAYRHVMSAVGDTTSIYYTAYSDSVQDWMLERMDRRTSISTPLLATPSQVPLILLGYKDNKLIYLQFDSVSPMTRGNDITPRNIHTFQRSWSLQYIDLSTNTQVGSMASYLPSVTLHADVFDLNTVPLGVRTPIEGIWFEHNSLLVAQLNSQGQSELWSYPLDTESSLQPTKLATAQSGHIFVSPTANSEETEIYWGDEWQTDDGNLHSNIWVQETFDGPTSAHGHITSYEQTIQKLYRTDGMSFHPVVANDKIFWISTDPNADNMQATPTVTAKATGTPTPIPTPSITPTTWADSSIYPNTLDAQVEGALLMLPLESGDPTVLPMPLSSGLASSLQAGKTFVLWQTPDGGYGMYNSLAGAPLSTGTQLNDAQFLAINGGTAVWTTSDTADATPDSSAPPIAMLKAFDWPTASK